jgi:hypothetical protein
MAVRFIEASQRTFRPPHHSHRTLLASRRGAWARGILSLLVGGALTYAFLSAVWPALMRESVALAGESGRMLTATTDSYIGITNIIPNPALPTITVMNMLWTAVALAVAQIVMVFLPGRSTALRFWISANLAVPMFAALYAFFTGHLAYDGAQYMDLVARTSLLTILCAPVFLMLVSTLLPFSFAELALMLVAMVLSDTVFALVRIVAFALLVSRFGAIVEMNLYMFFGPLMDVVYFITIYSLVVVWLSRRLNGNEGVWRWS